MSSKIEVSRELAQRVLDGCYLLGIPKESPQANELRALLAAPVVERQPVAYVLTRDDEVCYEADDGVVISNTPGDETNLYKWKPVYFDTSPPATTLPELDEQVEIAAQVIYQQWENLSGFVPWVVRGNSIMQDNARRTARACLDKVKELNQ